MVRNQMEQQKSQEEDQRMDGKGSTGLRIFLQYWILIAALGGFNFYRYATTKNRLSLIVGILCAVIFIGWVLFYFLYVRKKQ